MRKKLKELLDILSKEGFNPVFNYFPHKKCYEITLNNLIEKTSLEVLLLNTIQLTEEGELLDQNGDKISLEEHIERYLKGLNQKKPIQHINKDFIFNDSSFISEEEIIYERLYSSAYSNAFYEGLQVIVKEPCEFLDDCKNKVLEEKIENFKKELNTLYKTLIKEERKYLNKEREKIENKCYKEKIVVLITYGENCKKFHNETKSINMLKQLKLKNVDKGTYHIYENELLSKALSEEEVDKIIEKTQTIRRSDGNRSNIDREYSRIDYIETIKENQKI